MTAIGNAGDGILVHGNARNVVIGTDVYDYVVYFFGGCNLIAANKGNGITVAGNASQVSIHNNRIGIGAEIDVPMGNGGDGIAITSTAGNNSVVPMVVGGNGNVIVG